MTFFEDNRTLNPERLLWRLKKDEGYTEKALWDQASGATQGQYTNGWGTKALEPGEVLTDRVEAERRLKVSINIAIHEFLSIFKDDLSKINQVRAEAFINMIFNLGSSGFLKFKKMNFLIKQPSVNWCHVAREARDSRWRFQVGERAERLILEIASGQYYFTVDEVLIKDTK